MKKIFYRGKHSDDISLTWVKLWGHHKKMVCHVSDRAYYIIEGSAVFQVGDDAPGTAAAGDFVFVPRGAPYVFDGDITYVVMNGPAFTPGSDVELE
jgi:mannose-6-phosphate isomerase-like protein (cupin superfamily)